MVEEEQEFPTVSRQQYEAILRRQRDGSLTIFISTSDFRQLLDRTDPRKLSERVGQSVAARVNALKILSRLDAVAVLIACALSIPCFGWWAALVIPVTIAIWMVYRGLASRGRPIIVLPSLILAIALLAALGLGQLSIWIRLYWLAAALALFLIRLLYYTVARIVFGLIHSSYEFFAMFYLQPEGAMVPLIWTEPEFA